MRERVAAAYAPGQVTMGQVASRFAVSVSFVDKLLKRQRTSGPVAALPYRGGPAPRLQEAQAHRQRLAASVAAQPDARLAELRQLLVAAGALADVATARLAAQKKRLHAAERHRGGEDAAPGVCGSYSTRRRYAPEVRGGDACQLDLYPPLRPRAGRQRVDAAVPLHNGPNVTVIAARSAPGVEAVMELDGAVNKASFAVSLEQVLGPGLQSGDVVVLTNLPVHKAAGRAKLVGRGCPELV
ncbi:hypothetical protein [Hymenobacter sp. BRD67]|uniref:hypothetical protein n=1 Tax=Hymenobacter sp. BRD67 TaxID=2675877 RepID=UPI00156572F6|nr:hypothetical protein [Hymenobacter sp. BRD67]QKG54067.1 hypothetical protein GKZ67_17510 [Hymenobacter sp. BRD67]